MSTTTIDAAKHAQLDAIAASGVARDFHLLQPRNPTFWILAWGVVVGAIGTFTHYQPGTANFGGALATGTVAFAIYTLIWVAFLHWMDRFTPARASLLVTGFVWGALAATLFLALTVNEAVLSLYGKVFGTTWTSDWGPGFTAPFTEETAKAIGFVLLLGLAPLLIRSAFDGFVIGAFIGLGFEVAEDVLYVFNGAGGHFAANQVADVARMIVVRGGAGLASHALFTALVCTGIVWILGRDPRGRHVVKGVAFIVVALVAHGSWDAAAALGITIGGQLLAAVFPLILLVVEITLILLVGRDASLSERRWARAILEPEVERGALTAAEADAVSGTHKDRRHFIKAAHGHHAHKTAKHVVAAGRDLCTAIGRAGGAETPDVEHARAELARVRAG